MTCSRASELSLFFPNLVQLRTTETSPYISFPPFLLPTFLPKFSLDFVRAGLSLWVSLVLSRGGWGGGGEPCSPVAPGEPLGRRGWSGELRLQEASSPPAAAWKVWGWVFTEHPKGVPLRLAFSLLMTFLFYFRTDWTRPVPSRRLLSRTSALAGVVDFTIFSGTQRD